MPKVAKSSYFWQTVSKKTNWQPCPESNMKKTARATDTEEGVKDNIFVVRFVLPSTASNVSLIIQSQSYKPVLKLNCKIWKMSRNSCHVSFLVISRRTLVTSTFSERRALKKCSAKHKILADIAVRGSLEPNSRTRLWETLFQW